MRDIFCFGEICAYTFFCVSFYFFFRGAKNELIFTRDFAERVILVSKNTLKKPFVYFQIYINHKHARYFLLREIYSRILFSA